VATSAQTFAMLGNETLWDAARRCHEALRRASVPHAIVGGVAVSLHGYQRNTVDVDLLVRREDTDRVREALAAAGFVWSAESREFRSPRGIPVHFVFAGDRAGDQSEVMLPDPGEPRATVERESLPVLSLARLIETKLACGEGNLRRTHKDFADVVELIAAHSLSRSFARYLHKSLRPAFRDLVLRSRGAE